MPSRTDDALKTLTEQAAAALGPIAVILVEQAAEAGASFAQVRSQVAGQMDEPARVRFLNATQSLADRAAKEAARASPPQTRVTAPATATASTDTLDRSDPAFVDELARYLVKTLGADAENMVHEAARRCRTKMQLCMRLGNAIGDPVLKDNLLRRALDEPRPQAPRKA
ncbi:MAG TPA: hypothetical protein VKC64_16960 [Burkholderiales bacterium]|nr:hypothetical protein [Burkholderiales bacterium]